MEDTEAVDEARKAEAHEAYKEFLVRDRPNDTTIDLPDGGIGIISKDKVAAQIPEKYAKHLKDPNLLNNLTKEVQKSVVGEDESIRTIIISSGGKDVINCNTASYNLIVNGPTGIGKDFVVKAVAKLWPKDICIQRTRISPTAFTYWHNAKYEPEWSWDGKILVLQDISEGVLNSDVFKVMQSDGSSATIVINNRACDIQIAGKPVTIITTAKSSPNPELVRRNSVCQLDEKEDQTKAILQKQAMLAALGIIEKPNEELLDSLKFLKRIEVVIPFAEDIVYQFPTKNIIMRTAFDRFNDYTKASTALHQYQRERDKDGKVIASGQDYNIAADIFRHLTKNENMIPLTRDQEEILAEFKEKDFEYSVETLGSTLPLSDKWLREQLDRLVELGILSVRGIKNELTGHVNRHYKKIMSNNKLDLKKFEDLKIEMSNVRKQVCTVCTVKEGMKTQRKDTIPRKPLKTCSKPTNSTNSTHTTHTTNYTTTKPVKKPVLSVLKVSRDARKVIEDNKDVLDSMHGDIPLELLKEIKEVQN